MTSRDLVYDIETYPNIFCITFYDPTTKCKTVFEMSDRRDDWQEFLGFVKSCQDKLLRWVGFNNFYFDYQVIHKLFHYHPYLQFNGLKKAQFAYDVAMRIINMDKEEKFQHVVWAHEHEVPQIDLYLIHHFNNVSRATSLKKLEFNMRSRTIQDLPYPVGSTLTHEQKDFLIKYNGHDCAETAKMLEHTRDMITFREQLTIKYGKNFINYNDTKIGKEYFIMMLEQSGIDCFTIKDGERVPVQTKRDRIHLDNIIFDYIKFQRPEFNAVLRWLRKQEIRETKAVFTGISDLGELNNYANLKLVKGKVKNLNCVIDGFQFDFGTGGIHGSTEPNVVESDSKYAIIDYDVTSLYPSIAIVNRIYPKHLTSRFCEIYAEMKKDRLSYAKGTPENAMLKLALNGVYGDSNNKFSPFYDPQYTMTITINGQLMLCMLAEMHMNVEGLKIIQINTDGVTIKVPRDKINLVEELNHQWEKITGLQLERADYSKMFIRDVNNYIGLYTDGKLKRKGKYEYQREWHQDQSALVVQKAVESHFINGSNIEEFIRNHDDPFDFMLRTNVPRSSKLLYESGDSSETLQNVTRYYISNQGGQLVKLMPPLKGKSEWRRIKIQNGFVVTPVNTFDGQITDINYDWYIEEAYKLTVPLWQGQLSDLTG